MSRLALIVALTLASCGPDTSPPGDEPPTRVEAPAQDDDSTEIESQPPTPFDVPDVVFDTMEPPEQVVQFPPRPTPRPRVPRPRPAPPRPAPLPPPDDAPSGSCDVRQAEGYCLAFSG
ncbi:MAG: hypothetical protein WBA11_07085, partial [Rubrivirga sp.]